MNKNLRFPVLILLLTTHLFSFGQKGYDIKINFKDCKDSAVYIAKYFFDQLPIVDSCKRFKNGKIEFKGNERLDRGVYFLANQARNNYYFQFIVDDNQNLNFSLDNSDVIKSLTSNNDKENSEFFSYVRFFTLKNQDVAKVMEQAKGKSKQDSTKFVSERQSKMSEEAVQFDKDFMTRNKGTFVWQLMNLKTEKYPTEVKLAANGRPDSLYNYYYYKNHYFEGVDFKDDRVVYTPFFAERVKKYFSEVITQHPDTVIKELDKMLAQCVPGSTMFNMLVGHFTYKYETNKSMSFDAQGHSNTFEKVFVHLSTNYIINGKAKGYYSDETVQKIKERVAILKNLLPGAKVADLYMIDTARGREVLKMGFDTAKTSGGATYIYNKNYDRLNTYYKNLYGINSKYTILVFWAVDCGHCQTEIPKLNEELKTIKGKVDYQVFAVQTKEELFDTWKVFVREKKLNDFINVFDPIHINNLKEQFDITGTPVIYLLDRDKKIIAKKLASDQVVDILKKLNEIKN